MKIPTLPPPLAELGMKIRYSFAGYRKVNGVSCAVLHGTDTGLSDFAGMLRQFMGVSDAKDLKIKVNSYSVDNCFDVSRGVMVSREIIMDFNGSMTMPGPDKKNKSSKIKVDLKSKINMKIVLKK